MAQSDDWLRWRFLGNVLTTVDTNASKLRRKSVALTLALGTLVVAVVLLGGYFVYSVAFATEGAR